MNETPRFGVALRIAAVWLAAAVSLSVPLLSQRVVGSAQGTVLDPDDKLVPGAAIAVANIDTGAAYSATTDSNGQYRLFGLAPGRYSFAVSKAGFQTVERPSVTILVSQDAVVDFLLPLGTRQEKVEVAEETPLLETANAGLSGVVTGQRLRELPLNGRDVFHLTLLQPGVLPITAAGANLFAEGPSSRASVQGARPAMNNITMDGADINDPAFNAPPGGVAGIQLGVEAVREFRVLLNNYSAEFGRSAGANIQFVTRSGTNDFNGSLFAFHRNAALDARNFFDRGKVPGFVRNQFGFAIGGPIQKNRTFFFANLENLLENKSITQSVAVPDADAHRGLLPSPAGGMIPFGVDPRVAPFLDLYPLPNAGPLGGGLGLLQLSKRQPARENYGVARLDHALTPGTRLFGRYVIDDSRSTVPFASTAVPGFPSQRTNRNQYLMAGIQNAPRPDLVNDLRLNLSRIHLLTDTSYNNPLSISLSPGRPLGGVSITGLPQLGSQIVSPAESLSNTWELIDNLFHQRGNHSLKAGVNLKRMQMDGRFDAVVNGSYIFSDLTAFGIPSFSTNPALELFLRATPFLYLGADPALSDSRRDYRQNYIAFYAQDDWRLSRGLTLNLGLRWEYWSNPTEKDGRLANIRSVSSDARPTPGAVWESVPRNLWSPRLGFAWQPKPGGKTSVRGGFGLMRDQLWANFYSNTRFFEPYFRALQYVLPVFQNQPPSTASLIGFGGPPSVIGLYGIDFHPKFPYYLQYSFSVERTIGNNWLVRGVYAGSRGIHLPRTGEQNPMNFALGRRLNPNLGSSISVATDGQSFYNSGQFRLERRYASGVSLEANYTWSKSVDDQSGPFPSDYTSESGIAQNFFNRKGDRARSTFDRTHAVVANMLYEIPGGRHALLQGWTSGAIVSLLSGPPFTATLGSFNNSGTLSSTPADRPDLQPGAHPCLSGPRTADRWFDPSLFRLPAAGSFGNAGRNILCGPPLRNLDLMLSKQTNLTERLKLQFRADFFNLLNHANLDVPINTQGATGSGGNGDAIFLGSRGAGCQPSADALGCGIPAPNAGRIFRTVTTSRQIQFGLKLIF